MVRYVCALLVFTLPVLAGEPRLVTSWSENPKDLLWDLYASVFKRTDRLSAHHQRIYNAVRDLTFKDRVSLVDTLIYLDRHGRHLDGSPRQAGNYHDLIDVTAVHEMVQGERVPHYSDGQSVTHLLDLYLETNGITHDVYRLKPESDAMFASFLTVADRFDGRLDMVLRAPDLDQLYDLIMIRNIPLAAVGYNCRIEGTWVDRRDLIGVDVEELPKPIRKLMRTAMPPGKKLDKLAKLLRKHITPMSDDYGADLWQTSEETLLLGNGDCEDFSIMFQSIAEELGIHTEMVVGYMQAPSGDDAGHPVGHAWILYNGQVIDPINKDNDHVIYTPKIRMTSTWAVFEESLLERKPTDQKWVGN